MRERFKRPFLKWPGNKFQCLGDLLDFLPAGKTLVEPFVGSGAIFLNTHYTSYHLNDINADLIGLYQLLQKHGAAFIDDAKQYFSPKYNQADAYYRLRDRFNQCDVAWEKSMLFLYLNRHCYNGLCRYNQSGRFNVPFGRYKKPYFPEKEMYYFHQNTQKVKFSCKDFVSIMNNVKSHSVVYCDPPYLPLTDTANFTSYSAQGFGLEQQNKLAELAGILAEQGTPVFISNHDTPLARQVYHQAMIKNLWVSRFISCHPDGRKPVQELLACYDPKRQQK